MKIVCPNCNFAKEIDPAKIPVNAKRATCPRCQTKFDLDLDQAVSLETPPPFEEQVESAGFPEEKKEPESSRQAYRPSPATDLEEMAADLVASGKAGGKAAEETGPESGIPWEDRRGGFLGDFGATVKKVLFHPAGFFEQMPVTGGKKGPLTFGVIAGSLGIIFSIFWQLVASLLGLGFSPGGAEEAPMGLMLGLMIGLMILSPLLMVIGLYIWSAVTHFFLMIVRGAGGGFEATFRVAAYAAGSQLFNIVPILGGFVGSIWSIVLVVIGLKRAHRVGLLRVIVGVFILPILLVILIGVLLAVLGGILSRG